MGCAMSLDERIALNKSKDIDKKLKEDGKVMDILLLGGAESGKSTIMKQMKIIHDGGFTNLESNYYKQNVYSNIIQSITSIMQAMHELHILFENPIREEDEILVNTTMSTKKDLEPFSPQLSNALKSLWADLGVQECFHRSNEYQLNDSAQYFLNNIDRISASDFIPTEQDILRTRIKTTGIVDIQFKFKNMNFKLVDPTGLGFPNRRKWLHYFESVLAIIFCASLSEYDEVIEYEDKMKNIFYSRMDHTLLLFELFFKNPWFQNSILILFLNKKDLFMEKIQKVPIKNCFKEYDGPQDYVCSVQYIERLFRNKIEDCDRVLYCHHTCALDRSNIKVVFDAATDMIISNNLKNYRLETSLI